MAAHNHHHQRAKPAKPRFAVPRGKSNTLRTRCEGQAGHCSAHIREALKPTGGLGDTRYPMPPVRTLASGPPNGTLGGSRQGFSDPLSSKIRSVGPRGASLGSGRARQAQHLHLCVPTLLHNHRLLGNQPTPGLIKGCKYRSAAGGAGHIIVAVHCIGGFFLELSWKLVVGWSSRAPRLAAHQPNGWNPPTNPALLTI